MRILRSGRTGIVRDARFLNHLTGDGHPESPGRLVSVYKTLDGMFEAVGWKDILPREAKPEEIAMVHSSDYVKSLASTSGREPCSLTPDTHTSPDSYSTALLAAGGTFETIARVVSGEIANGFVLLRPPGHHAERSRALGYCLLNNVALGAMFARRRLGLKRVLIVDWDVHHGNGTQHIFEDDPSVLFFSIHQYPLFPGTGIFTEIGRGKGEGFTVNIPLKKGYGDSEYVSLFETILRPLTLEFAPELILVSAGFDSHRDDPLGGMRMTPAGFAGLTRSLMDSAEVCCNGRLVLCLEGGYHARALGDSVASVILELTGATRSDVSEMRSGADPRKVARVVSRYAHVHRPFRKIIAR